MYKNRMLRTYILRNLILLLIGVVSLGVYDYLKMEIPKQIGLTYDSLSIATNDSTTLISRLTIIVIILVVLSIFGYIWKYVFQASSQKMGYWIRNDIFKKLIGHSQSYLQKHQIGEFMSYFSNDIDTVRMFFGQGQIFLFETIFLGVFGIYQMARIHPKLMLTACIPIIISGAISGVIGIRLKKKFAEIQETNQMVSAFSNESIRGIEAVKSFVRETIFKKRFAVHSKNVVDKTMIFVKQQNRARMLVRTLNSLVYVAILVYGGYLVLNTTSFTPGDLMAFYLIFMAFEYPIHSLSNFIETNNRGKASLDRVYQVYSSNNCMLGNENEEVLENVKGNFLVQNLSFSYGDNQPVLNDMNLNIYQGETVALIGAIGSGKTTLIDLILKFYKVDDNRIFIDGIDINRIDTTSLRNNISYITQETVLFSQSIAENIKFGKQDASFNEIIDAAIVSNFHSEIINFEKDYKTVLGEKGVNLSGGQRQRLSIARSIIKNSPILIIDDALSAVDKETENELMKNLKEIRSNKTTILITHRVASVQFADKIFILEKGRNLVSGTHNELISSSKYYQDLYAESADEVKNHE